MADMLRSGQEWLANQLKSYASRVIVYQRGTNQITLSAVIGRTLLKLEDGYGGVRMEWTDRDFLIAPKDLVIAGAQVTPERGDMIRESEGNEVFIHEVMVPGSEPPWRWSDPHRQLFRVHTKQIGVA